MAVTVSLLDTAKNYLDITYTDEAADRKLSGILERGMRYIDDVAGRELDYSEKSRPQALLFDYARYARSNALDEFQVNYLHELLSLQIHTDGGGGHNQGT